MPLGRPVIANSEVTVGEGDGATTILVPTSCEVMESEAIGCWLIGVFKFVLYDCGAVAIGSGA